MKSLRNRVERIEKLKKTDHFDFKEFLSQYCGLFGGCSRGIPSQPRGLSPEKEERINQLSRDYPEYVAELNELIMRIENQG